MASQDNEEDKKAPLGKVDPTKEEAPKQRMPIRPEYVHAQSHPLDQTPGSAVGPAPGTPQGSVSGVAANDVTPMTPKDAAESTEADKQGPQGPGAKH